MKPCTSNSPVNKSKNVFKYFLDGGECSVYEGDKTRYYLTFGIYFNNKRVGEITVGTEKAIKFKHGDQILLKDIKRLLLK